MSGWIEREAVMSKPAELREQTDEQLELLLKEVQHNLFRLRLQSETERLEAPSEIVKAKRESPGSRRSCGSARSSASGRCAGRRRPTPAKSRQSDSSRTIQRHDERTSTR